MFDTLIPFGFDLLYDPVTRADRTIIGIAPRHIFEKLTDILYLNCALHHLPLVIVAFCLFSPYKNRSDHEAWID